MADLDVHEGDFIFTNSVVALYHGNVKATFRAPKGKVLVLVAMEVADKTEMIQDIGERVKGKLAEFPARTDDSQFPVLDFVLSTVVAPMRF